MEQSVISVIGDSSFGHCNWTKDIIEGLRKAASNRCQIVQYDKPSAKEIADMAEPVILLGYSHEVLVDAVKNLRKNGKRVILVGLDPASISAENISCITQSRSRQTVQLIQYLLQCGRKKIALVGPGQQSLNDTMKVNAALHYPGGIINENDIFSWSQQMQESFQRFIPVAREYDAVICPNDYVALRLLRCLFAENILVPGDLFITSFSDCMISRFCRPSITSITMDYPALGRYAFILWQQLRTLNEDGLTFRVSVPGKLVVRDTTARIPVKAQNDDALLQAQSERDLFYADPSVQELMRIENCLSSHDDFDMLLVEGVLENKSYETICEENFLSMNALHYRLNKIFRDALCKNRAEFAELFHRVYGPFHVPK